ncbi:hypothetical protein L9F63_005644, partial [Diploptera punctata]
TQFPLCQTDLPVSILELAVGLCDFLLNSVLVLILFIHTMLLYGYKHFRNNVSSMNKKAIIRSSL